MLVVDKVQNYASEHLECNRVVGCDTTYEGRGGVVVLEPENITCKDSFNMPSFFFRVGLTGF